jgi:hypothetical protein
MNLLTDFENQFSILSKGHEAAILTLKNAHMKAACESVTNKCWCIFSAANKGSTLKTSDN